MSVPKRSGFPVDTSELSNILITHQLRCYTFLILGRGNTFRKGFTRRDYRCGNWHFNDQPCPFRMKIRLYDDEPNKAFIEILHPHVHSTLVPTRRKRVLSELSYFINERIRSEKVTAIKEELQQLILVRVKAQDIISEECERLFPKVPSVQLTGHIIDDMIPSIEALYKRKEYIRKGNEL